MNESGGSKKLDVVKSYARNLNRRVSRAFSFSQDTPNKIKKTISSVFRSPFQTSYTQQSLNEQKASKLTSLASLQLTPTLMETKRKFITLQKTRDNQLFRQHTCSAITTQTTSSSLLSLDSTNHHLHHHRHLNNATASLLDENYSNLSCSSSTNGSTRTLSEQNGETTNRNLVGSFPDITNIFQSNAHKRQLT